MNKETGELIKKIIDMFVSREEVLKELLDSTQNELRATQKELQITKNELDEFNKSLS